MSLILILAHRTNLSNLGHKMNSRRQSRDIEDRFWNCKWGRIYRTCVPFKTLEFKNQANWETFHEIFTLPDGFENGMKFEV